MSRWLASERTANWGASQLYLILAGAILGPAALGGLKAAQGLVTGPTNVVINGSGSFGLPEASRHFAERGWAGMARVTRFVTGATVSAAAASGVIVFIFAPTLIKLLYGPQFVSYAPCARIFACSLTIYAFTIGPISTSPPPATCVPSLPGNWRDWPFRSPQSPCCPLRTGKWGRNRRSADICGHDYCNVVAAVVGSPSIDGGGDRAETSRRGRASASPEERDVPPVAGAPKSPREVACAKRCAPIRLVSRGWPR